MNPPILRRLAPLLPVIAFAVLLGGCGNRSVLLTFDALSFTQPADRAVAFGPVPALPVAIETGEIPIFDDLHVTMLGDTRQIVQIDDVTVSFTADMYDSTGSGSDTLRVYISDKNTPPQSTTPVVVAPVLLTPAQHVPVHVVLGADPAVRALFLGDEVRVSVTSALRGPSMGAPLNGRVAITELRATVSAKQKTL